MGENQNRLAKCNRERESATSGLGGNKLRTYRLFKSCFGSEYYLSSVKCESHRSALAKFRYGVAPINIELGRYALIQ